MRIAGRTTLRPLLDRLPRETPAVTNMTSDAFTVLPPQTATAATRLRVATYNIHKGVRGMGAAKRLEIHNLVLGVEALDADLVFLQEVRLHHTRDAARFDQTIMGWPEQGQAEV